MIQIINHPIDIHSVVQSVEDPSAGAIDMFIGTTRDESRGKKVIALDYEAYAPMALRFLNRIAGEAREGRDVRRVSIVHRVGRLNVGEASVVIAVSAAHRKEAFEACRYIIDTIKKIVPIWKKEFFEDGEIWVGMEGQPQLTRKS